MDAREHPYAISGIANEIDELANTGGGRNPALNKAAFVLGGFVGAGALSVDEATAMLTAACEANGYARRDGRAAVQATIRSGLRSGMKTRRQLPEPAGQWAPRSRVRAQIAPLHIIEDAPTYPPLDEVESFWRACVPVTDVRSVSSWLEAQRIDAEIVADMDLARAVPQGTRLPTWAAFGCRSWIDTNNGLIARLFDARGVMRSVLARRVVEGSTPKSVAPKGYQRKGLVLACSLARQILATGARPEWWPADQELRIVLCEGEKKHLIRCTLASDGDACAPAIIGIEAGSWTSEIAGRIPDGCTVFIATDPDQAGAQYATKIIASLADRIRSGAIQAELREGLTADQNGKVSIEVSP